MRLSISKQKGVTLLEMMMTIAIVAIVLTVVAPSIQSLLIKNRVVADTNELSSVIQFARNVAIDEQANTVICPSADFQNCSVNWNNPKIVFIDDNNNASRETSEALIVATQQASAENVISGPSTIISFDGSGAANNTFSIKLCHSSDTAGYARQLDINLQGRVKLSQDSDQNGIHEDSEGVQLDCN